MAPATTTPPEAYSPAYCESVHVLCHTKMDYVREKVDDIHGAVFGSEEQPGLIEKVGEKVSTHTVRWMISMVGGPIVIACLLLYAFYVRVPLVYLEKDEFNKLDDRVLKVEETIKNLPTAAQIKDVMKEALREHTPSPK